MIRKFILTAAAVISLAVPAIAEPLAKDVFGHVPGPTGGAPVSVGGYSRGCVSGAVALPETGPTWQAMRLSRNRNWGHPELVGFLIGLSQAATQLGWRGLYVGDISQALGGPRVTGHASHQIGLHAELCDGPRERSVLVPRAGIAGVQFRWRWSGGKSPSPIDEPVFRGRLGAPVVVPLAYAAVGTVTVHVTNLNSVILAPIRADDLRCSIKLCASNERIKPQCGYQNQRKEEQMTMRRERQAKSPFAVATEIAECHVASHCRYPIEIR